MSDGLDRGRASTSALRAMAELRLRLTLRRLTGKGGVPDLVARTVMLLMAVPVGIAFAGFTAAGAYTAVHSGSPLSISWGTMGLFLGIWCSWTALGLTLDDRESFDLRRMLVYPVSPVLTFVYELVAALVGDPFALFWSLLLLGGFGGAAVARPGAWILLLAAVHLLFAGGTVCLVKLLQELLARALRLRRFRELGVAAIYVGCLLVAVNVGSGGVGNVVRLLRAVFELRWAAYPAALAVEAATRLYRGEVAAALPWIAGQAVALLATASVAYRLALSDALAGGEGGQARGAAGGSGWRLPGRAGPILEKELKYLLRHPLMAVLSIVVPVIAGAVGLWVLPRVPAAQEVDRAFPLFGFALYALLVTQSVWLNAFGGDRGGARTWFLAPVPLGDVLWAKNAAARVMSFTIFAACAIALFATGGVPPLWAIAAALALHLGAGTWFVTAGNLVSILHARPASHGLQRGASVAPLSALLGMVIVSAGTVLFLPPVLLVLKSDQPWSLVWGWAAVGLLGVVVRRAALPATVRLLERRREALLASVAGDDA